jgi:hypothetical protein
VEWPLRVTVALVGDEQMSGDLMPESARAVPYAKRRKVELDVGPEDFLGDVLRRAAEQFGATYYGAFVAFYRPEDETGLKHGYSHVVPLLDDEGRVTWRHMFPDVPYHRLIRAYEAGALDGDPRRPYLLQQPGIGDGVVADWPTLKAVWDAAHFVLENLANIGGAAAVGIAAKRVVIDRLRNRSKAVTEMIEQRSGEWAARGGDPADLYEWLDDRPWSSADLADMLGCTEGEAGAILWAFGFTTAQSGLWRRNQSEEGKFFNETNMIGMTATGVREDDLRRVMATEIKAFLASGQARPDSWQRVPWTQPPGPVRPTSLRLATPYYWLRAWWQDRK